MKQIFLVAPILIAVSARGNSAEAQTTATQELTKKAAKPNIVIIYSDDMGVGDLSCLNDGWVRTPNIDRMASQGVTLTNYYTASPVSSPSRVGLTTGMFPMRWGINTYLQTRAGNANCEQFDYLDASAPSMAQILKDAGYRTAHIGKWHMGGGRDVKNAPQITRYGFDEYISTWESPDPAPELTAGNWIWGADDQIKRWNRTEYFIDKTLDFMERHSGEPCFVNLWPDDMHSPYVPDVEAQEDNKNWDSKEYFVKVLAEYDRQIGYFLDELDRRGLSENTIVIFTSDNGPGPSFDQIRTNHLRGMKNSLYEGGIRMPFIVRWPGKVPAGMVDGTTVVCAVDMIPSLSAIAGAELPKDYRSDGEDMSRALLGKPVERNSDLMWSFGHNEHFNKPGKVYHQSPALAIRRGNWKMLVSPDGEAAELYDLSADPNETTDLSPAHPGLIAELKPLLLECWQSRPNIADE